MNSNCTSVPYDPNHWYIPCMKPGIALIKKRAPPPQKKEATVKSYIWVAFKKYYLNSLISERQLTCK